LKIKAIRGMKDLLPPEDKKWRFIEDAARETVGVFGFNEVRAPILERTELFVRSIGDTTDVVEKEMYTFSDRSGESLTMRPEATAGVLRSYVEHKIYAQPGPHKLFTIGPMFRHERPQKGRLRQFNQLNCEILGDEGPLMDAELMVMLTQFLERIGLTKISLVLNSLGCQSEDCRPAFRKALIGFLEARKSQLCEDCLRRMHKNPLRVLDCKSESCKEATMGAPSIKEHLCDDCRDHFGQVKDLLDLAGVVYTEDPRLVRGLDYYVRTTFEAQTGDLGAQNAVAGGGRYDGLIEQLGGPAQGGIGFAAGIERLALLAPDRPDDDGPDLFIAALGPKPREWAFGQISLLRKTGLWADMISQEKSLKAQMRRANKLNSKRVLIVGDNELEAGSAQLKDMQTSEQREISLDRLAREISKK
jgi:histidyl-tRNA synthetase